MAPRSIELVHPSTGEIVTTDHIVAIDESGTCNDSELFCISAVYCTRSAEAQLAEWMIEADMKLWKEKPDETQFGATDIPTKINKHPSIDWFAIVASDPIDRQQKAAAAITAAAYALIQPNAAITHRPGTAAVVHDGGRDMYGTQQIKLRKQALSRFDTGFCDSFAKPYLTHTKRGDQIYPSVMLADMISWRLREKAQTTSVGENKRCAWFQNTWVETSNKSAPPLYNLHSVGDAYDAYIWENFTAWLRGRGAADNKSDNVSLPIDTLLSRTESNAIATYLQQYR